MPKSYAKPAPSNLTGDERELLARYARAMLGWHWFPALDLATPDAAQPIARLLFGLYLAHAQNKALTRGEAAQLMGVDSATTTPRYIAAAEAADLVEVERRPDVDKRKEFVRPTLRLVRTVETELRRLAVNLAHYGEQLSFLDQMKGIDPRTMSTVPPGAPTLEPLPYPPPGTGTVLPPRPSRRRS